MKSKKHVIFLMISIALFVASVIAVIVYFCEAKAELDRILSENTDTQFRFGLEMSLFFSMFFTIAVLGSELSFVRSVYKMLKHKPRRWIGICLLVSAILAFSSVAFYCLVVLKVFNFVSASGRDYTGDVYLLTFWPSFLVSFALGGLPVKQNV